MSVHEFYRLEALITLQQVNTTEWSKKKTRILISKQARPEWRCKRVLVLLQITASHTSVQYNTHLPPTAPFKVAPPSFEHALVLLATLVRGGGHLSRNEVQCLQYFCNWL